MESAGLDGEEGRDQYASSLPKELWDPDGFENGVYKEGLAKKMQEVGKRKEEKRKGAEREFVPPKEEEFRVGVRGGNGGSAAERVMAGLERRGGRDEERDVKRRRG